MKSAVRFAALNLPKVKETEAWKDITSMHKDLESTVESERSRVFRIPIGGRSCVIL
jgi:hypothetical protein